MIKITKILTIAVIFSALSILLGLYKTSQIHAEKLCVGNPYIRNYTASCDPVTKNCTVSYDTESLAGPVNYNGNKTCNNDSDCGGCKDKSVDLDAYCDTWTEDGLKKCATRNRAYPVSRIDAGFPGCNSTFFHRAGSSSTNAKNVECKNVNTCKKVFTSCSGNRCNAWPQNCNRANKDCGDCSAGWYCNAKFKGKCVKKPDNSCNSYTCDPNTDPPEGRDCDTYDNGTCSGTKDCGGCPSGYTCKGKNGNNRNGNCRKNKEPSDPTYSITVLVFYDRYTGAGQKKGSDTNYNLCFPATSTSGAGSNSGDVTVTINGKNYTKKMYKNCRRDGNANNNSRGFVISGLKKKFNSVKLVTPGGAAYDVTGYNYTKQGSSSTKVVTSGSQAQLRKTPNIEGNFTVRFGVEKVTKPAPPKQVSGFVFLDDNANGIYEPEENDETLCYNKNVVVRVGSTNNTFASKADCSPFSYDISGTQTVSLNPPPAGFVTTGLEYIDENNPVSADDEFTKGPVGSSSISLTGDSEVHFGIREIDQEYTISGNIFNDTTTPFRRKNSPEANYTGATATNRTITITDDAGAVVGTAVQGTTGGGYTFSEGLNEGTYTLTYGGAPAGYDTVYPVPPAGLSPSFTVTVGTACSVSGHNAAACDANGNITNLDFAINAIGGDPWYQTVGGNLRNDSANSNKIPASGSCTYTTQYASAPKTTGSTYDAGLVFNSNSSIDLGATGSQNPRANPNGRLITGKKFKPARGGGIRTAYAYLKSVADRGGQSPKAMYSGGSNPNPPCAGQVKPNCILPSTSTSTFTSGVYTANEGLTIPTSGSAYNFGDNKKFVFLIIGDIHINRDITVSQGSSVAFIATGNIYIGPNVTEVAGIFSANKDFIVEESTTPGNPLTINGSVIANASNTTYKFDNQRANGTGIDGDGVCPSVRIVSNPGLILNAPAAMKVPNYTIAEVAPGPISSSIGGNAPTVTPTNTPTPTLTPTNTPTPTPSNTPTPTPTPIMRTGAAFSSGALTLDAEAGSPIASKIGRSNRDWENRTSPLAFTGSGYIAAVPDSGTNLTSNLATTAPEVKFNVCFPAAGRYWIWTRGSAPNSSGDAIAYGIDGSIPSSANPFMLYIKDVDGSTDWEWRGKVNDGSRAYIDVPTAGFHNFNLYMRNDGARIDKIYLRNDNDNPSFAGTANGGPSASGTTSCADNN